ncbi:MAG: right-handed parallel beta-helix repeat-containing protein, partial [Candidatus Heimdallarchaeota archaeon]|nr:right-handed parallel beta-helix repeat-containing protein [Candidatus Heimdallarchaeota archaeon]
MISNDVDIYEINSIGNIIEDNVIKNKEGYWILEPFIIDNSGGGDYTWIEVSLEPWCTGSGTWKDPYIIENASINGHNLNNCLEIQNSNVFFIIKNSIFYNASATGYNAGLWMSNTNNSKIMKNEFSFNKNNGLHFESCYNNTIIKNNIFMNDFGIDIRYSSNNSILNNYLTSNDVFGIHFYHTNQSLILNNTFANNNFKAIVFQFTRANSIIKNDFYNNTYDVIDLSSCSDTSIKDNFMINFQTGIGIAISSCNSSIILNNTIYGSSHNYRITLSGYNNTVFANTINGTEIGIYLNSNAENALIYCNIFLNNDFNAQDYGVYNQWDNGSIGNYWDDYLGKDQDDNGIGDIPYYITGSAGAQDRFPIWNDGLEEFLTFEPFIIDDNGEGNYTWAQVSTLFWCYGFGTFENPYIIEKLIINGRNSSSCITIKNSNVYFTIKNCTLYNSGNGEYDAGIKLENVNNGRLINNNCSFNNANGITLFNCQNNLISGSSINNNMISGIKLIQCFNNSIVNNLNSINNNGVYGIYLNMSNNNTITGNTIYNNQIGIYFFRSNFTVINNNQLISYQDDIIEEDCVGNFISL